jgi:hypothetical protein
VTALLFELGKAGLAWYLARPSTTASFGATGSLVVLILWVFYASCILFFGAEFTKIYAAEANASIEPSDVAERIPSCDADGLAGAAAKVPAEPNPLDPNAPVPALPMKETLAPMLATTMVEPQVLRTMPLAKRPSRAMPMRHPETWMDIVRDHPVAQIGAAIGAGWLIGAVSRAVEQRALGMSATEHFAAGSRKSVAFGWSLLSAALAWAARHFGKDALRHYGEEAREHGTDWAHELATKLEKATR